MLLDEGLRGLRPELAAVAIPPPREQLAEGHLCSSCCCGLKSEGLSVALSLKLLSELRGLGLGREICTFGAPLTGSIAPLHDVGTIALAHAGHGYLVLAFTQARMASGENRTIHPMRTNGILPA